MAGRYDLRVFEIWNKFGLAEAVQYYLFERISKKYNNRFYSVEDSMIWDEGFQRYYKYVHPNTTLKDFRKSLEKEKLKNVFEYGNKDCVNVMYFSMENRYI